MILKGTWKVDYTREVERAKTARAEGNEGMARVCARRAAGIVIGEYLNRRGLAEVDNSAYKRLFKFVGLTEVDDRFKQVCNHFLMKVNPEHKLPGEADLIGEVTWLEQALLYESDH
jgi:hypothetical protein